MTQQFSWITATLLVFVTRTEAARTVRLGASAVLTPGPVTGPIKNIMWKHNGDIAAEWFGAEVAYYRQFKGRCELNTSSAELSILSLALEHSGSYTAQVNGFVLSSTDLQVLASVPKPTVSESWGPEKKYLILSCDGNATGAGPLNHTWMSGDRRVSYTKDFNLTKDATEPSFHCVLRNAVSSGSSEEVSNPFIAVPGSSRMHGLFALLPLVGIIVILGIVLCKCGRRRARKEPGTAKETRALCSNGSANNAGAPTEFLEVCYSECRTPAPTQETSNQPGLTEAAPEQLEERGRAEAGPAPPVAPGSSRDDAERRAVSEDPKAPTQDQPTSVILVQAEVSATSPADRESSSGDVQPAPSSDACDNPDASCAAER